MTTRINNNNITVNIADNEVVFSDFVVSHDKHAITISMTLKNIGTNHALLSLNNFFVDDETEGCYPQQCYISDGTHFEVISGWKSFMKNRSYTVITKFILNPNVSSCSLYYKTATQQYLITKL